MKLVVGLGNPGEEYENTRHNSGFMVAEKLAGDKSWLKSKGAPFSYSWIDVSGEKVEIVKPLTFMNKSGEAVVGQFRKHEELTVNDLFVVHDDLDISLGRWKIDRGKGPRDHGGVNSIEEKLGSKDFWRVRIGVDSREGEYRIPGEKYVLMKLNKDESELLNKAVDEVVSELRNSILK